jgi:hypothetical protein
MRFFTVPDFDISDLGIDSRVAIFLNLVSKFAEDNRDIA